MTYTGSHERGLEICAQARANIVWKMGERPVISPNVLPVTPENKADYDQWIAQADAQMGKAREHAESVYLTEGLGRAWPFMARYTENEIRATARTMAEDLRRDAAFTWDRALKSEIERLIAIRDGAAIAADQLEEVA